MRSKLKLIVFFGVLLLVISALVFYPEIGKRGIEKDAYAFLQHDGYEKADLALVEVRHSYIGGLLGYGQWHTSIVFADEPNTEYECVLGNAVFPKVIAIRACGFSADTPESYAPRHYPG